MNIRLVPMAIQAGQAAVNAQTLLAAYTQACRQQQVCGSGIDLVVAPELCVPGYLLGDLWELPAFGREVDFYNQKIIQATAPQVGVSKPALLFGTMVVDPDKRGRDGRARRYNAWILAQNGQAVIQPGTGLGFGIKTLLPNYREFDESRYFFDLASVAQEQSKTLEQVLQPVPFSGPSGASVLGVMICEDLWDQDYSCSPSSILKQNGAELFINLSQSPYTWGKTAARSRLFDQKIQSHQIPLLYVNGPSVQNNGKTVFVFDGQCSVWSKGRSRWTSPAYGEQPVDLSFQAGVVQVLSGVADLGESAESIQDLAQALIYGTKHFCKNLGINKTVIGVSGGIDSAVSAALFVHVLGADNVLLVNMPSQFNSVTTKDLARDLAQNLGAWYTQVDIDPSVALTKQQIQGLQIQAGAQTKNLVLSDFHFENIQARDRSSRILAALSAAWGGPFPSNANKAETMVGYSTLYGDHAGFLAPLADLWKHQVYDLAKYFNEHVFAAQVIPRGSFSVVPSAELSLAQDVDQGRGDPLIYPYHDRLFQRWMQSWNRWSPEETLQSYIKGSLAADLGCPEVDIKKIFPTAQAFVQDLEHWWKQFQGMGVAKRIQAPPVLALSQRAFGFDFRETQTHPFWSQNYQTLKSQLPTT